MGDVEQPQYPRFESYANRVVTYATWTEYKSFDKDALAQAGLYNIADGTTDATQVRCFSCGQEFSMSPEDDFLFQHFKRSPNCRYLRQKLGPNRINEYKERIDRENQHQQQVQGTSRNPVQWTASDCIRSPQYQAYSVRLESFARWPSDIRQTPEHIADAGFYFTGLHDLVCCFACDGGLQNWDPEDDPWVEHARWFQLCPFVKCVKGQEFINFVQRMTEESDDSEEEDFSQSTSDLNYSVMATSDLNREAGHSAPTAEEILGVIFGMEARREMECNEIASSSSLPMNANQLQCSDQSSAEETQLQQRMRCANCGKIEILFILCNNHCTVRNCAECKFICSYCSRTVRERDT